jgi:hypothetical protein
MTTLRQYFAVEAVRCVREMDAVLRRGDDDMALQLHEAARGLRGVAQMAREEVVQRAAASFEAAMLDITGDGMPGDDVVREARATVDDLARLVGGVERPEQLASGIVARWSRAAAGPSVAPPGAGAEGTGADVVDVRDLCFSGERALRAALELRAVLELAVEHQPDARDAVDEVFDLIRLGLK